MIKRTELAMALFHVCSQMIEPLPLEDYRAWPIYYSLSLHLALVGDTPTARNTTSCA